MIHINYFYIDQEQESSLIPYHILTNLFYIFERLGELGQTIKYTALDFFIALHYGFLSNILLITSQSFIEVLDYIISSNNT